MEQWIVIFREHDKMIVETKYYGPFDDLEEAYEFLGGLPALGPYDGDGNHGVKWITELEPRR